MEFSYLCFFMLIILVVRFGVVAAGRFNFNKNYNRMKIVLADVEEIYKKDLKLKPYDVKNLQEWMKKQPHLPKISELQIILFLHSCCYSNEAAKKAIDAFFTVKTLCPDIFGNRNPNDPALETSAKTALRAFLPGKTKENYTVIYTKIMDSNIDHYVVNHELRLSDMTFMLNLHKNGPSEGIVIIGDMEGSTLAHSTKINMSTMKKWMYYVQEAMPIRLKSIHYINTVSFLEKFMIMMKPFIKKEIYEMIHIHSGSLESLYKFVPKEMLPKDIGGGSSETFATLQEKNIRDLKENAEFFMEEELQLVDESKRPGKPKNAGDLFGIDGTFKKLEID